MMETFATRIKKLRLERNLSQKQLADELGITRVAVLKWENGENKPSRRLFDLARFFGVSEEYLIQGQENANAQHPSKSGQDIVSEMDLHFLAKLHALDPRGRDNVLATLNREYGYATA